MAAAEQAMSQPLKLKAQGEWSSMHECSLMAVCADFVFA